MKGDYEIRLWDMQVRGSHGLLAWELACLHGYGTVQALMTRRVGCPMHLLPTP